VIYETYASFLNAFPSPIVENFGDSTLQPGLSVGSTYPNAGNVASGGYYDIVGGSYHFTTTWTNSQGFTAFGGNFDLSPGNLGTGISVTAEGVYIGEILFTTSTYSGFWGFSTGNVFNNVEFSGGTGIGCKESYMSVDLAYTQVPEPAPHPAPAGGRSGRSCCVWEEV
jgi:hypothetical protein